jgi:hypothetical protein
VDPCGWQLEIAVTWKNEISYRCIGPSLFVDVHADLWKDLMLSGVAVIVAAAVLSNEVDIMFRICFSFFVNLFHVYFYLFFLAGLRRNRCTDPNLIFHSDVVGTSHEPHVANLKCHAPSSNDWSSK